MTLKEHLAHNVNEIETILTRHRGVITQLGGDVEQPCQNTDSWPWAKQHPLKQIVLETIEELELSRQAFKSKQLEALRKKLIKALAENG
jgi:hypothetical protein